MKANSSSARQVILCILEKLTHYYFSTTFCNLAQPWSGLVQSSPCCYISLRFILMISCPLYSVLTSCLFRQVLLIKSRVRISLLLHMFHVSYQSHSSWFDQSTSMWWEAQFLKRLIMQFSPVPSHFFRIRPKYIPQHPILKHPQPIFFRLFGKPSFKLTQNNGKNYSFNFFYVFLYFVFYPSTFSSAAETENWCVSFNFNLFCFTWTFVMAYLKRSWKEIAVKHLLFLDLPNRTLL